MSDPVTPLKRLADAAGMKPDVLMSDIGMPGTDGYELIQKIRSLSVECGGSIPAAAVTAYAREEDRQRALAAGFQTHIPKPVIASQLIEAVAHLATFKTANGNSGRHSSNR